MNKQLQQKLADYGFYKGAIDGIIGAQTLAALDAALANDTQKVAPTATTPAAATGNYTLNKTSIEKLAGVNADLVRVVHRAIQLTSQDFVVIEGLRTLERQKKLVASGASKTLNSNHIKGLAVDLAAVVSGTVNWNEQYYYAIADAMRAAAKELGVRVRWGGAWVVLNDTTASTQKLVADYAAAKSAAGARPFFDLVHFEIFK